MLEVESMGRDDDKKIPEEGTTAPDGRPQLRATSSVFEGDPASTLLDEDAEKRAALQAAADHVLGVATTEEERPRSIDLGPGGTDATLLNLAGSLDDTRPRPPISQSQLDDRLVAQQATVAGHLAPDGSDPAVDTIGPAAPGERPLPDEPSLPSGIARPRAKIPDDASVTTPARPKSRQAAEEGTAPGELAKANTGVNNLLREFAETEEEEAVIEPSLVVPREHTPQISEVKGASPRLAATLTFVPEADRERPREPKPRGVPKHESLLDRIGEPAPAGSSSGRSKPRRPRFLRGSPLNIVAFAVAIVAVLILMLVVVVSMNREAPKIESRPLPSGPTVGE